MRLAAVENPPNVAGAGAVLKVKLTRLSGHGRF